MSNSEYHCVFEVGPNISSFKFCWPLIFLFGVHRVLANKRHCTYRILSISQLLIVAILDNSIVHGSYVLNPSLLSDDFSTRSRGKQSAMFVQAYITQSNLLRTNPVLQQSQARYPIRPPPKSVRQSAPGIKTM